MKGARWAALVVALALPYRGRAAGPIPEALSLDQALERLDAQNLTLAQARSRAAEARAMARQAMAAFLPTVGASGSYVRNNAAAAISIGALLDSIEGGLNRTSPTPVHLDRSRLPTNETVIQPIEAFTGSGSVRVPIFAANAYSDYAAAKQAAEAATASAESARLQVRASFIQAAWLAGAMEDTVTASERALAVAKEHEESAARAVQAGNSPPLTHLQAQTEVVRRESDLARTMADRERSWLALGILLGKAEPVRVALPPVRDELPPDVEAQVRDALERRPEIRVQEASVASARAQLDSAWWRLAPQVAGNFSAFASTVAFPTGEKTGWTASAVLTWPLYDGGLSSGKRAQAQAQIIETEAALQAQRLEVGRDVRDAARDLDVARERLQLAQKQKSLAEEAAASARRLFGAGLASSLDVLDANDRLYQADVGLADAKARVGTARAALDRATGGLL